jgi:hypothetical protein
VAAIRVETTELAESYPCKAFYDNIEEQLSVGVKRVGKFHSYIEGECFSFDLTRNGHLLNIDLWKPKREWISRKMIAAPEDFERQDIRFLDYRLKIDPVSYYTNSDRSLVYICFSKKRIDRFVSPANSLVFELDRSSHLVGLWVTDIEQDFNFRKEARWRRSVKAP